VFCLLKFIYALISYNYTYNYFILLVNNIFMIYQPYWKLRLCSRWLIVGSYFYHIYSFIDSLMIT